MTTRTTIGKCLVDRLVGAGVKHVFGVPGDYVLRFYDLLEESPMDVIGTVTEAGAGFAADAYARVNGLGVVCITYCVGGLNVVNAVAGAYAEKSPLIVISGAPGLGERARTPLLHHKVRDFNTQRLIFDRVTVASAALEDPREAPRQIDEVIAACMDQKRPVYIEIPRDIPDVPCVSPAEPPRVVPPKSDRAVLKEALDEASEMLRSAKRPVIVGGVEIHRFGLQRAFLSLVERSGFPVCATLLGKSIIREDHPQYAGVYEGAMGRETVRKTVERADAVLILGAFMTDINLGIYTANLDINRTINATSERLCIRHHSYDDILLRDFINGLARSKLGRRHAVATKPRARRRYRAGKNRAITVRRFFARMDGFLRDNTMVIADIGDSLFGAADLTIHRQTEFLSPAYYTCMGFGVPAALGAQINKRRLRPIVFVGDGAFQMTCQELSSIVRQGLAPIVFVLNNKGYTTERFIHDGPYNDIHEWAYHRWPDLLGRGWGCEVRTEEELEEALKRAWDNRKSFSIVNLHLDPMDGSHALERLAVRLSKRVANAGR